MARVVMGEVTASYTNQTPRLTRAIKNASEALAVVSDDGVFTRLCGQPHARHRF